MKLRLYLIWQHFTVATLEMQILRHTHSRELATKKYERNNASPIVKAILFQITNSIKVEKISLQKKKRYLACKLMLVLKLCNNILNILNSPWADQSKSNNQGKNQPNQIKSNQICERQTLLSIKIAFHLSIYYSYCEIKPW